MTLSRRRLLAAAALAPLPLALARRTGAAAPLPLLKIFVPANPGGGWDQTARSIEQAMKAAGLIRAAQLTNVGGAGGTVGLPQFVNQWKGQANAVMVSGQVMVGAIVANKPPVSLANVTPVARLTGEFDVVVVPAASPHRTLADVVAALKANPGAVSWAGGSAASIDHMLAGLIAKAAGVDPRKVAYVAYAGGGPAVAAILGGQVTCGVSGWAELAEHIKAGKMRALALSSASRVPGIDVPTLKELGYDIELMNWRGVFAPPGLAPPQVAALVDLFTAMARSKPWADVLAQRGWVDMFQTGDAFAAYIDADAKRVAGVLKDLGLAG
jgi:putative tricarboxylic transport membrane protein